MAKRMQFQCKICNQEMNSHGAVADHFRSGKHQKNLDKLRLDSPAPSSSSKYNDYSPTSIQYKFLKNGRAVGLQFLEEFWKGSRRVYYRCILCGAHGKIDAMYNHMVGARHVEKYIKTTCSLKYPALTANEREGIRKKIIDEEGINVNAIAIYDDPALYPSKWEAEGAAARTRQGRSIKEEIKEEIQKSEPSGSSSDNEPEEPCKLETKTQATQTEPKKVTWSEFNDLCNLFYLMIAVDGPESTIKSVEDLEFVVELQIMVSELLYKVNDSQKPNKDAQSFTTQRTHLSKILGSLMHVCRSAVKLARESAHANNP
ncbi:uncharacterized protein LOC143026896 [Oratosquilla oratoria]|uniref:uncharacterized protein LOC143026896 n=1 Tax=Oratosquilla oratoria TaxID=337810 RepID=UPI003F7596E8